MLRVQINQSHLDQFDIYCLVPGASSHYVKVRRPGLVVSDCLVVSGPRTYPRPQTNTYMIGHSTIRFYDANAFRMAPYIGQQLEALIHEDGRTLTGGAYGHPPGRYVLVNGFLEEL